MQFVNPTIPESNVRLVIVDKNAPIQLLEYLKENNIEYILSTNVKNTIDAVSTHPDMQICNISKREFVCEPTTYEYYKKHLEIYGANVSCGHFVSGVNYPADVAYNVVVANNTLIHNVKYTDTTVLSAAKLNGYSICNVKQGYTKCATCIINKDAAITADVGIYNTLTSNGFDCLLIKNAGINLGNRNDGFIGGCCGLISSDKLLFCGDINMHSDAEKICSFVKNHGVEPISAFKGSLTDIGSIIPVMQE